MICEKCGFEFRQDENFCARCHYSRKANNCEFEKWQLIEIIAKTYSNVSYVYYRKLGGNSFSTTLDGAKTIEVKKEIEPILNLTNWAVRE